MVDRYCRNFHGPAAAVANDWAHAASGNDAWKKGSRQWGTNSKPFEVINSSGWSGVAKPGPGVGEPDLRRAAHEKLASDLAFLLELPIPPVTLCDEGQDFDERHVAVSIWAFPTALEWQKVVGKLSGARRDLAIPVSSAMAVFDTWIGASDRKADHVLVNDDGDEGKLDLAYIDYAFAFTKAWDRENVPVVGLAQGWPIQPIKPIEALEMIDKIEALGEGQINEIVTRVPLDYLSDAQKGIIINNLLTRRSALQGVLSSAK